jgi:hypothetical protein
MGAIHPKWADVLRKSWQSGWQLWSRMRAMKVIVALAMVLSAVGAIIVAVAAVW